MIPLHCRSKPLHCKITQFLFKTVLSLLFLVLLFFLAASKIMSTQKASGITYEDAVQNILALVENDDMED